MARARYDVVHPGGQWKIKFNGEYFGPYPTQKAAVKVAVDAAHASGGAGHDAQVYVHRGDTNEFRLEWTYGHDPYPPSG